MTLCTNSLKDFERPRGCSESKPFAPLTLQQWYTRWRASGLGEDCPYACVHERTLHTCRPTLQTNDKPARLDPAEEVYVSDLAWSQYHEQGSCHLRLLCYHDYRYLV